RLERLAANAAGMGARLEVEAVFDIRRADRHRLSHSVPVAAWASVVSARAFGNFRAAFLPRMRDMTPTDKLLSHRLRGFGAPEHAPSALRSAADSTVPF